MDSLKGNINIISLGGISKIVLEILNSQANPLIRYIYDDNPDLLGKRYNQIEIKGTLTDILNISSGSYYFNGLGNYNYYERRILISQKLTERGCIGYNVHHNSSIVSPSAIIGPGAFLPANVNIGISCNIGADCIIFSNTTIEHESKIGKITYISPGAIICGKVIIGDYCYIGPGSVISAGVKIGNSCIIGAGSVVLMDLPDYSFAIGSPAKTIKRNSKW